MNEIKNNNLISSIKKNLLKKVYYNIIFVFKGFYYNYKKNIFYVENKKYFKYTKNNLKIKNKNKNFLTKRFMKIPTFKKFRISSYFDLNRIHPITKQISPHFGIDFATPAGTPVLAVGDGEILVSKKDKIAGNYITINHGYKCFTKYMHLKKIFVKRGQKVKKGEKIALSGNTGRSTGPHLHFEIWIDKIAINPMKI
ncbi:MAG: peptidoglycan DD-metalloendopeptidase family protein [Enterobacteriaceae bacterium]